MVVVSKDDLKPISHWQIDPKASFLEHIGKAVDKLPDTVSAALNFFSNAHPATVGISALIGIAALDYLNVVSRSADLRPNQIQSDQDWYIHNSNEKWILDHIFITVRDLTATMIAVPLVQTGIQQASPLFTALAGRMGGGASQ